MRELDLLLLRYLERDYPLAAPAEQAAFVTLLSRQDPDILALLAGRLAADDVAVAHVVTRLLTHR
jgi:succinate dehydrogenase flavin-adding protein (antitoxin of CptAB toxin-antitoxin module)